MNKIRHYIAKLLAEPEAIWENTVEYQKHLPLIALVLTLFVSGASTIPEEPLRILQSFAADPWNSDLFSTYHGETPLFFLLAHGIGATTPIRYLTLCGCMVIIPYLLIYLFAHRYKSPPVFLCILLFASHPIAYILQTWLGMVDGITVIATVILVFSQSVITVALISLVLMLNHSAAPFIALPLVILRTLSGNSTISWRHIGAVIISLLLGILILINLHAGDIENTSRFSYMLSVPWTYWVRINITHLPLVVYSMYFSLWLPAILMIALYFHENRHFYGFYVLSMVGVYCMTLLAKDTTRVYALLSWGQTFYCFLYTWDKTTEKTGKAAVFRVSVVISVLLGWSLPRLAVWDGAVYTPWFDQFFRWIWRILLN